MGKSKITPEQRSEIAEKYEAGSLQKELASSFGVSQVRISQILREEGARGRSGSDVQPPSFDVDEAVRLHEEGVTQKALSEYFGVAQSQISKHLSRRGVTRPHTVLTYDHDLDFFDVVDPLRAYWAGFIAADGCVTIRSSIRNSQLKIGLHPKDIEILERLKSAAKVNNPIHTRRNGSGREYVYFRVTSPRWAIALEQNYNITPSKAKTLEPPTHLDEECSWAFARGYFDGDGCAGKNGDRLNITSGSMPFMEWIIQDLFESHHKIMPVNGSWSCYVSGPAFRDVARRLYEGSTSDTRLSRKYERFRAAGLFD